MLFTFKLTRKHAPNMTAEEPQLLEIEYEAKKVSTHVSVIIKKISFTPIQLNHVQWTPQLFSDIFNAAKESFAKYVQESPAFWDAEKEF